MSTEHSSDQSSNLGGFDASIFETLAASEGLSFWFRSRNKLIVDLVSARVHAQSSFLEIGCGTGYVAKALQEKCRVNVTGVDLFDEGLAYARKRVPGAKFTQGNALELAFDSSFDAAGAFDVIEHIVDDLGTLKALRKAVRPGGWVFVTVPQHKWLWSGFDDYSRHVRRYDRRELLERLRSAGLEPVQVTSFVSTLLPVMAIARLRKRRARNDEYEREFTLPRPVDKMLEKSLDLERWAIRRRWSLPVGGSLVVVARRPPAGG